MKKYLLAERSTRVVILRCSVSSSNTRPLAALRRKTHTVEWRVALKRRTQFRTLESTQSSSTKNVCEFSSTILK